MKTKSSQPEKILLGIDPGTNVMGYGVLRVCGNKAELVVMGVIDMRREKDVYLRLGRIFERVTGIIDEYLPDEVAVEAPFFGKNVQSMLKLGRAQGVVIAAATGNGSASKEQVAGMLQKLLHLRDDQMPHFMDATDAVAAAYCHFLQMSRPETDAKHYGSWKDFARKNADRIR